MPINPNIALGVQQQQPVNMLGQMGQMLALKGAVQEMQGSEEMRNLFAGGANFDDPEFQRRGYMANAKGFAELLGKRATTQKTEMEVLSNDIKLRRDALGDVNTNEDYLKWHDGNHVGRTGAYFKSIGVSPSRESIIAQLNQPGGLEKLKQASALGSTKLQQNLMDEARALKVANIGAAAPMMNARLAREQYDDKLKYGGDLVTTTIPNPENPKERIEIQTRRPLRGDQLIPLEVQPMPMRVEISPNSATSAFQPLGVDGGGGVNALNPQSAAAPNVNALNPNAPQGPTFAQPKPPFRAPVAAMVDGKPVLVAADKAIGMTPATAFTEKQAAGKVETVRSLNTAISNLTDAIKPGGLLEKSTGSGFGRMVDASAAFVGKATEGAKAAASLAPIADLVLKMVPRFEGPQSDKDTQSYKEAAGQLADSGLPNETRKDAAKVILRLMKERKDQFGMSDQVGGGGAGGAPSDPLGIR